MWGYSYESGLNIGLGFGRFSLVLGLCMAKIEMMVFPNHTENQPSVSRLLGSNLMDPGSSRLLSETWPEGAKTISERVLFVNLLKKIYRDGA